MSSTLLNVFKSVDLKSVGKTAADIISLSWADAFDMEGIATQAFGTNKAADSEAGLVEKSLDNNATTFLAWSVTAASVAELTIENIDEFIRAVDEKRADLGAIQNRMEATIRNQSNISENESDARSRIRDTDFASETAALTQNNIIQQASQTVLAQANQRPTIALSLLGQ